jgi:nitroreductase
MDVLIAINKRHSVRGFKPDPVPPDILKKIVEGALRSPSASNSQPWELAVVSGAKLEEIKKVYIESIGKMPVLDVSIAPQYPEPWASRRAAVMAGVLEKMGVARDDKQKRMEFGQYGSKLWGAPSCIYIIIDRDFYYANNATNHWNIFDCGLIAENIMLLATEQGLGTIPAIQPVLFADVLRKLLGLPDSKLMVMGIPIGYEDTNNPANKFRSTREPLEKVAKFYT